MKLSILVNVYNGEKDIPHLLGSLLKQMVQDFELVIIDDGSTDRTSQIVHKHAKKFKNLKLITVPHIGLNLAREHGFSSVTGDVCLILDADETLPAVDTLERFLEPFADPQVAGVGGIKLPSKRGWMSDGLQVIRRNVYAARLQPDGTAEIIIGGAYALRVKAVSEVGGLTKNPNVSEDTDISWRLREAGWKLIGRNDIVILHKDPTTLVGVYSNGYKLGKRGIHNYLKHPRKFLFWKTWTRFYPLGVLVMLVLNRKAGLGLLGLSALFALWMFRLAPASFVSKARGWFVWTIHSLGWDLGFLAGILTWIRKRIFN